MKMSREEKNKIKEYLFKKLEEENAFWSYDRNTFSISDLSDDQLISLTMRHLDLEEIKLLFSLFSRARIQKAWREILVPEGDYLYTLNRFFAWYYFKSKRPDQYLKSLQTRHFNKLLKL